MTLCATCHGVIGAHENPHIFDDRPYCADHCPHCAPALQPSEPQRVAMAKRCHRRGTPKAWAMRGAGG